MQHPLIDQIYEKLHPYESVFKEILEQAKEEENELNAQLSSSGDASGERFELTENKNNGLKQMIENWSMGHKQVDERCKPNSGGEECVEGDQVQDVPFEERRIANELRKCCNLFGVEIAEKLRLSAKHFLELGKVYLNYALNEDWQQRSVKYSKPEERTRESRKLVKEIKSQQNLNFVKAAALMVGAIVRFEKLKDPENIQNAKTELCRLHREIMKIDHVKGDRNVDILKFTKEIKRTLEIYRKKIAEELKNIAQLQEANNGEIYQVNAGMRDSKIRDICDQCTEYYLAVMAKVAEKCESIMGKPPCKYSIIGLGSLARKEATLYSDFEHAILLDDEIGDDSEGNEYFRWFSTIFQVVIIGLGETIIPSVGVKSLNNFYSSDERKDWFRDEYTPCGVSFDGMMPHACKIPAGRQEPTKRRSHTVELIQPVSKMVNFLTKEEEVKNGYFLSDILSKVCLVFGSHEVYDDYLQKSCDLLKRRTQEEIADQQLCIIERNPNSFVRYSDPSNFISDGKIKTSSYRPLTTLLSCAAALHSLPAKSSFEIVDEMGSRAIIDNQMRCKLISAVATAMEIRLRTYLQAGNQRTTVAIVELEEQIGRQRLMNCYFSQNMLKNWLRINMFENLGGLPSFAERSTECFEFFDFGEIGKSEENSFFECTVLMLFNEYEKAMWLGIGDILQTVQRFRNSKITALESGILLSYLFGQVFQYLLGVLKEDNRMQQGRFPPISGMDSEHWEWLCGISRCYDNETMGWIFHELLCEMRKDQRMFEDARREKQEAVRFLFAMLKREVSRGILDNLNKLSFKRVVEFMDPDECLQHLNELLNDAKDFLPMIRLGICHALHKKGMKNHARDRLRALLTDLEKNARHVGQHRFNFLLYEILEIQIANGFITDIISTNTLLRNNAHVCEPNDVLNSSPSMIAQALEKPLQWKILAAYNAHPENIVTLMTKSDLDQMLNISWGGLEKVFSAFSHKAMIEEINCLVQSSETFRSDRGIFNQASCLMVWCEAARATDLNLLINFLRSSPYKMRSRPMLQPFLYALFADFLHHRTLSIRSCSRQKATFNQLLQIASEQGNVIQALFGYTLEGGNLHNLAITYFREFRFVKCAKLCWKQLHRWGNDPTQQERSMKLFLTTVLTTVLFQKRRSPAKSVYKTREISLQQILLMFDTILKEPTGSYILVNLNELHSIIQCNLKDKENSLVQVLYLATVCLLTKPSKAVTLLWRIVHAQNVPAPVLWVSIHSIIREVSRFISFRLDPISYWEYGANRLR